MIPSNHNSNDYLLSKRTQVKFCFTVYTRKYALALVNSIYLANFESLENFTVYAGDDEAKQVLTKYKIPYVNSYGLNPYHDKILNLIMESYINKDTVIVNLDCICCFDFHDLRGMIGRSKFKNNHIYLRRYKDLYFNGGSSDYIANLLLAYNCNIKLIDTYLDCIKLTKKDNKIRSGYPKDSMDRYDKWTTVTEEEVIKQNFKKLRCKLLSKILRYKLLVGIRLYHGQDLNKMIKNQAENIGFYHLIHDIHNELKK